MLIYFILSSLVFVLAIAAVPIAQMAMRRGLTYSAMHAVVWTLAVLAIGRLWHTIYEFFELEEKIGSSAEIAEYLVYILAYILFIGLVYRSVRVKIPKNGQNEIK